MVKASFAALIVALLACPALADAPAAVSGNVLLDGKPLPGVRVTDGVNFATTGADGAYSLTIGDDYMIPYRPARTVSVCWPGNTWPAGKWWVRLSDVSGTDAKAVNFALRTDEQKLPFVFLHISDDHGSGKMYTEHYAHDARAMKPMAKFIFNTGDMGYATSAGAEEMFRSIDGHAKAFPVPMFFSPGNHDFVGEDEKTKMASHPLAGWGAFTKYCGPVRWSFDYAGVHFVSIDYMEKTAKGYRDMIPHIGVQFLEKDLATMPKDRRVVLLVHCYDASADFFKALHKYRVDQVCAGHTHVPLFAKLAGVPSFTNYGIASGAVTAEAIDVAERRPLSYGNSSLLGYFKSVTIPAMEKRRLKQHTLADKTLSGTRVLAAATGPESVEIIAEITPGSAKKVGLRVGAKDAIEITFDGAAVSVAGAPVPFSLIPQDIPLPPAPGAPANAPACKIPADTTLKWHILIDHDRLSILGNNLFRLTKAIKVDQPGVVSVLAEGGQATFKKVDVWELKTISNPASRGLHHFAPPAWTWGVTQHVQACLDDKSKTAEEILKRYNAEGVVNYDAE